MNEQFASQSTQLVHETLVNAGLPFRLVEFSTSTHTAVDAAQAIGCEVAQIVKSLIFYVLTDNQPLLVLASGINRVNEKIVSQQANKEITKANATYIRQATGFAIGGVAPVGYPQPIETYIDRTLLEFETLWAAAGTPNSVFEIKATDLVDLTKGKVIVIA